MASSTIERRELALVWSRVFEIPSYLRIRSGLKHGPKNGRLPLWSERRTFTIARVEIRSGVESNDGWRGRIKINQIFLHFPESGGDSVRDLLDDLRADPVRRYGRPNQDRRIGGEDGLPGHKLPTCRHSDPRGGHRPGRRRLQLEPEGENIHRLVLDGEGHGPGRPRAHGSRQGRLERPFAGLLRRDRDDHMRSIHLAHGPRRCHHNHSLRPETSHQDHGARRAARGLEGAQTLDSRHFHHQRGPGPRGDRKREEALRRFRVPPRWLAPSHLLRVGIRIEVTNENFDREDLRFIRLLYLVYPNIRPSIYGCSRSRGGCALLEEMKRCVAWEDRNKCANWWRLESSERNFFEEMRGPILIRCLVTS